MASGMNEGLTGTMTAPECDQEEDYEERLLGPLGLAGVVALVIEVLCGCATVVGFVAMIVFGISCLTGTSDATGCGPFADTGYPKGGLLCLALGWLPCTFCFCVSLMRKFRRKRVRVNPLPNGFETIGLDIYYANATDVAGTIVGPIPLFEAATRVLRQAITADTLLWPSSLHR